jgi:hypothetical protein
MGTADESRHEASTSMQSNRAGSEGDVATPVRSSKRLPHSTVSVPSHPATREMDVGLEPQGAAASVVVGTVDPLHLMLLHEDGAAKERGADEDPGGLLDHEQGPQRRLRRFAERDDPVVLQ